MNELDAVKQKYMSVCAEIGDRCYKIKALQNDLEQLYAQALELNKEAAVLQRIPVPEVTSGT